MELIALDEKGLRALYDRRLREDFPPAELRPFFSMRALMAQGVYLGWQAWEGGRPLGYALCAVTGGAALLDYFAVEPDLRGQGVGGRFLQALGGMDFGAPLLLIEAESVESASAPAQVAERTRRLRFYHGRGCLDTGVFSLLFGVEYQILALPLAGNHLPGPQAIQKALEGLYRAIVPSVGDFDGAAYRRVCQVFLRPAGEH